MKLRALSLPAYISIVVLMVCSSLFSEPIRTEHRLGLPITFEPNVGQSPAPYKFLTHGPGVGIGFTNDEVHFSFARTVPSVLKLKLLGSQNGAKLLGEQQLAGKANYIRGRNPSDWHVNVATFARVRYSSIYPQTDLLFYGNGTDLEHDFVVSPGGNPFRIKFVAEGAESLRLSQSGDVVIKVANDEVVFHAPVAFQERNGTRIDVPAAFTVVGNVIGIRVASYDKSLPLVIDPVLTYSTYLAGTNQEFPTGLAIDNLGNSYVTGYTTSPDFPTHLPYQPSCNLCTSYVSDIFVTKLDPTGKNAIFSTFIGGSGTEQSGGINVDASGNVIIGGSTFSTDFPFTKMLFTPSGYNQTYGFLLSLRSDGSALNYATLVGTVDASGSYPLLSTADSSGAGYLVGFTYDQGFPLTPGTVGPTISGYPFEATFITKLTSAGDLAYSTTIPGTEPSDAYSYNSNRFVPKAIAVDGTGNLFLAGDATPGLPTTPGSLQPDFPGPLNNSSLSFGFVLKLNPTASAIPYATYIPESSSTTALALESNGSVYIAGPTTSRYFPVTAGAYQTELPQSAEVSSSGAYVARLSATGSTLERATYLSGATASWNGFTSPNSIAIAPNGTIIVAGNTGAFDFPLKNPIVTRSADSQSSGFLTQFDSELASVSFSTYLTGQEGMYHTRMSRVLAGSDGTLYATGSTDDSDFPTTPGAFQTSVSTQYTHHVFVTRIDVATPAPAMCISTTALQFGIWLIHTSTAPQEVGITNCGNANLNFSSISISGSDFSQTNTCGQLTPGASCKISVVFTPASTGAQLAYLNVVSNAPIADAKILLTGEGGQPVLNYFPSKFDAGDELVGTTGGKMAIVLWNSGNGNLLLSDVSVTGDFSQQNFCTSAIPPNGLCRIYIFFSPTAAGLRTGTLTVTSNAPGSPHSIGLNGTGITVYPAPTITQIESIPMNTGGGTVKITGSNFFPATKVQWNGSERPTTYVSSFEVWATLTGNDLKFMGEFPVTVSTPTPGGGVSTAVLATVYKALGQSTSDMVYSPATGLLYVSVGENAAKNANRVLGIDPATGSIAKTFNVGNDPHRLALSDDGKLLYVGLNKTGEVAQVSLPLGTVNFKLSLGADPNYGTNVAADIAVVPGHPHTFVVSLGAQYGGSSRGIRVFDDQVARTTSISSDAFIYASSLLFLPDPSIMYVSDMEVSSAALYRFTIDANGITLKDNVGSLGGGLLSTDGTLIYEGNGRVVDPALMKTVGTYELPMGYYLSALVPDKQRPRLYAGGSDYTGPSYPASLILSAAKMETLETIESIILPEAPQITQIARWGTDGLALRTGNLPYSPAQYGGNIILLRTRLTSETAAGEPDFVVNVPSTSTAVASGQPATYNLSLSASGGFSGNVALTCTGAPTYATCTVSPSSLTLAGTTPTNVVVTVKTTQTIAANTSRSAIALAEYFLPGLLMLLPLFGSAKRLRRSGLLLRMLIASMLALGTLGAMVACGGGGGGGGTPPPNPPTSHNVAPGTYTLTVTAQSGTKTHQTALTLVVQ